MRLVTNILLITALVLCSSTISLAQKKATKNTKAKAVAVAPTQDDINFENLLPSTAKVQFIDSTVVALANMYSVLHLSKDMGKISSEWTKDSLIDYYFENEIGSKRIIAKASKENGHKLYSSSKLGRSWSDLQPVEIPGDFSDIICPYLMPDGQTLYFAAKGGEDNVGGYDIFYTYYDTDDDKFITPQSIGLPFNSKSHEFYYIVDETSNLGYLFSQRKMQKGKVCLYTFIPTETRETYTSDDNFDEMKLKDLAEINSIKATQTNSLEVQEAIVRLNKTRATNALAKKSAFSFQINSSVTYHSLSDFKVQANRDLYKKLLERKDILKETEDKLASLRIAYHKGDKSNKAGIVKLENSVQTERINIAYAEKQIRNSEIQQLTTKK